MIRLSIKTASSWKQLTLQNEKENLSLSVSNDCKTKKKGLVNKNSHYLWSCYHNKLWPLSQTHTQSHKCTPITPNSSIRVHSTKWIINKSSVISEMEETEKTFPQWNIETNKKYYSFLLRKYCSFILISATWGKNIQYSDQFSLAMLWCLFTWLCVLLWCCLNICQSPNPCFGTETACGGDGGGGVLCAS